MLTNFFQSQNIKRNIEEPIIYNTLRVGFNNLTSNSYSSVTVSISGASSRSQTINIPGSTYVNAVFDNLPLGTYTVTHSIFPDFNPISQTVIMDGSEDKQTAFTRTGL